MAWHDLIERCHAGGCDCWRADNWFFGLMWGWSGTVQLAGSDVADIQQRVVAVSERCVCVTYTCAAV